MMWFPRLSIRIWNYNASVDFAASDIFTLKNNQMRVVVKPWLPFLL